MLKKLSGPSPASVSHTPQTHPVFIRCARGLEDTAGWNQIQYSSAAWQLHQLYLLNLPFLCSIASCVETRRGEACDEAASSLPPPVCPPRVLQVLHCPALRRLLLTYRDHVHLQPGGRWVKPGGAAKSWQGVYWALGSRHPESSNRDPSQTPLPSQRHSTILCLGEAPER